MPSGCDELGGWCTLRLSLSGWDEARIGKVAQQSCHNSYGYDYHDERLQTLLATRRSPSSLISRCSLHTLSIMTSASSRSTLFPNIALSQPLHITVRFTTSTPDLLLDIESPSTTTVIYLKHLIRSNLSSPTSTHRLRLIYSGKILLDESFLSTALKVPPPPPRETTDSKGKSKAVEEQYRVYVNCSIGDPLTAEQLEAEALAALSITCSSSEAARQDVTDDRLIQPITTTPAPRGFDRLLSTGFTPAEVGQLRLQFLSIRAANYTPDTLPSPTAMRRMEDEWIDDNGATAAGRNEAADDIAAGAIDDLLWGLVIGFMWPLGAMGWLAREPGVWSVRRETAVWGGFVISLAFGFMYLLG